MKSCLRNYSLAKSSADYANESKHCSAFACTLQKKVAVEMCPQMAQMNFDAATLFFIWRSKEDAEVQGKKSRQIPHKPAEEEPLA